MQTKNVSFTGFYKIPNTPENIKLINEKVIPMYSYMKHEKVVGFIGDNPLEFGIEFIKETIGKSQGASKEWVMMNAKNFGIDLPKLNTENLFIISGEKDILKFVKFFKSRIKANSKGILEKIINFFKSKTKVQKNLPEHLRPLPEMMKAYNAEATAYRSFLSNKKITTVSTPQELLSKMLTEK